MVRRSNHVIMDPHRRYAHYMDFGAGEDYETHVAMMRKDLSVEGKSLSTD